MIDDLGPIKDMPVATPVQGIAAIALHMAMQYHSINTVQDGALYQQYKLEGRNMVNLDLSMVFDTAIQIEQHLISRNYEGFAGPRGPRIRGRIRNAATV